MQTFLWKKTVIVRIQRTKVGKMIKCDLQATDGDPTNRNINYDIVSSTHEVSDVVGHQYI